MPPLPKSFIPDVDLPKSFVPDVPATEEKKPGLFSMNTLKGETTYPAIEGGAGTIAPNIARTFGNIPSSGAKIVRNVLAPVNPIDVESPINIGGNIVKGAV